MNPYLEVARQGQNQWWRYLISLPLIVFSWLFIGSLPLLGAAFVLYLDNDPATGMDVQGLIGIDPIWNFFLTVISFIPLFLSVLFVVRYIHKRPAITLVTAEPLLRWKRMLAAVGVWMVIAAGLSLVEALIFPGRYLFTFDLAAYWPYALLVLLFIPIQTSAEEFLFRGYFIQGLGVRLQNPIILSLLSGFFFTLPHLANPELAVNFWLVLLFYFVFGAFAAWITLRDGGMELALGLHAGNNLFTALFANYTLSALQTPAVFTIQQIDAVYNLFGPLLGMVIFALIFFRFYPRNG